jgi:rhodanese-related sulfurtransferase
MACRAGELRPEWWPGAVRDANRYGYEVADHADLVRILDTSGGTILDVRPDYEYAAGHLPGAKNLEFHMGDGYSLTPDKRRALLEVLGPDRDQLVIIYCRSLQ